MRLYAPDIVRKPMEQKSKYKGAAVITPEQKWRQFGEQRRERMERLLKIGTRDAIAECRKLRFYPAGVVSNGLVFQARMHFLAGLLDSSVLDGRVPPRQRLLQLQDSALDAGYELIEIDPKTHMPI